MEEAMMLAIYPGSFDPLTYGHLDIIERAAKLADRLIVAVLLNSAKTPLLSAEERVAHLRECTAKLPNVDIVSFSGLLADFAKEQGANILVRGLRAATDFEYEFQIALVNRTLAPDIETIFIAAGAQYMYLSSSVVREVHKYGGNVDFMVPPCVRGSLQTFIKEDK